jgi:hypothetical protein
MPDNLHAFNYAFPSHALGDWGLTPTEITPIDDYCLSHTMKILLFCENLTDSSRFLPPTLFSQLQSVLADRVNLYLTDAAKTVQIAPREATKYSAAERIRQSLHLAKDEIAVFGDDHNDAEMLSHCESSVAMGSAPEEIRRLAAFTTGSCEEDGIAFIPVREIRDIFIASEEICIAHRTRVEKRDLAEYPLMMLEEKTSTRRYVSGWLGKNFPAPAIELATSDLLLEFAVRGIGIASIVEDFARDAIREGRVIKLPMAEELPPRRICVAYLKKLPMTAAAKKMTDRLMEVRLP